MKTTLPTPPSARAFAAVAGSADFLTGLGLLTVPELTLRLMGVAPVGAEAGVFLQFVGAFVAAVGASYLLVLRGSDPRPLAGVFRATLIFRIAAGSFVAWAVATGRLELRWISVTVTDYFFAIAQAWWLRRPPFRHE